jgi:hypothetical protein
MQGLIRKGISRHAHTISPAFTNGTIQLRCHARNDCIIRQKELFLSNGRAFKIDF